MKNKLLTLAGVLALVAVLGTYYAKPLLAQVRAAVTKNIDEPARVPYQAQISCGGGIPQCDLLFGFAYFLLPGVPAHSRVVIEQVSLLVQTNGTVGIAQLGAAVPFEGSFPGIVGPVSFLPFTVTQSGYVINQPVRLYFDTNIPTIGFGVSGGPTNGSPFSLSMQGTVSGYVVDLNQ